MSKLIAFFLAISILLPVAGAQAATKIPKGGVGVHNGINMVTIKNHKFVIDVNNNKVVSVKENRGGKMVAVKGSTAKRKGFTMYYNDCTADVYSNYYPYPYLYSFWWC